MIVCVGIFTRSAVSTTSPESSGSDWDSSDDEMDEHDDGSHLVAPLGEFVRDLRYIATIDSVRARCDVLAESGDGTVLPSSPLVSDSTKVPANPVFDEALVLCGAHGRKTIEWLLQQV